MPGFARKMSRLQNFMTGTFQTNYLQRLYNALELWLRDCVGTVCLLARKLFS